MAEHGGTIRQAAQDLGWSYDNTKHVWHRLRKIMGPQAA
jgi:molybdenum-dependent DNA-binding transcriptional regulator ModE